ncbi:P-loop containing nucleoside triphosphate hydrolase protein [Rhypophila decipiens]|uniref:DNA 3'-5' helicase n=1 Tax=Rhypophila decipiens TaxID=261697 RepID=A0AAN6XWU9_9PEZI|nr:P-loop containing nucleoside triphosphate hydrolase protein [Rhypophila decipiens]
MTAPPPPPATGGSAELDSGDEFDQDDVFDDIDEADLAELEQRPAKRIKREPGASPDVEVNQFHLVELADRLLKDKFGFESFRHEQHGAIRTILAGENALVVFPTGAGKSLCYQIPAIAFPELDKVDGGSREPDSSGVTLVVSPLIALMKDQVDALKRRGIAADSIDSSKTWEQLQVIHASMRDNKLRILYCAPERLNNEGFVESIKHLRGGIRLLAVDEAHCVSEWGHSFRPDYLKVARFVDEIKAERVICLTATATPKVAEDICKAFKIGESCVFKTSPYRPNLMLHAKAIDYQGGTTAEHMIGLLFGGRRSGRDEGDVRFEELFRFLRANPGPTLVYVALQHQAELHAEALASKGFSAAAFHAGLKQEVKKQVQEDFMAGKIRIVCATIAFGMGIDKADIRNIVHWDLSSTVEEYSQQIGRAGRDGKKSVCMFLLAPSAFYLREVFARGDLPSRQSLKGLLMDIISEAARGVPVGGVFKLSQYAQGRQFDIRPSPLQVIYATLELHFGLFRAITPEYSTYKFEAKTPSYLATLKNDRTPAAKAILSSAVKKVKFYDIDVKAAAMASGGVVDRADIIKKLNQLNDSGIIELHTSGLLHRYTLLKNLPDSDAEVEMVVDKLYQDMQGRERDAIRRGREVVELITGSKCFALALAEHFGMTLPDNKQNCGHCTFCLTRKPVVAPVERVTPTTRASISGVLAATNVRDDPRFLARVAFGIKSPRVSQLKLDKHDCFRSLAHHSFDALLREFTKACKAAN